MFCILMVSPVPARDDETALGMTMETVGVCGCGLMGSGIAEVAARAGCRVVILEATAELCARGLAAIAGSLDKAVARKELSSDDRDATLGRLSSTVEPAQLAVCDLVIEAIVEDLAAKQRLWQALAPHLKPTAVLASNTSSLSIADMMLSTGRPERFLGLHFFNPVPRMALVEASKSILTDPSVYSTALDFTARLGKTAVEVADRPGFIVNRLLIPYLLDAVRVLEQRVAGIAAIDQAMKLGCGYPLGPLALIDLIGIDTTVAIAEVLHGQLAEPRFSPPPLLRLMVRSGWLGRKSGQGFYDYADRIAPKPLDELIRS
jgi:3-hydroxybutyryl-CoA dehydrogenase